tara:strand:+ start:603 stop:1676 length:1074 start_codon:yes stop_codon:yes gene_type:complete
MKIKIFGIILAVSLFSFIGKEIHAVVTLPDNAVLNNAIGYQNLITDSTETAGRDIFFLVRYDLPVSNSDPTKDWCKDLYDTSGCSQTSTVTSVPLYAGSLPVNYVILTLLDETGTVRATQQIRRIENSLSGIYFTAGHGLDFGNLSYQLCLNIYGSVPYTDCLNINWSYPATGETQTDYLSVLEIDIKNQLMLIESAQNWDEGFLLQRATQTITQDGQVYTRLAFAPLQELIPDAFQASGFDVAPTAVAGGVPVLEQNILATATKTPVFKNIDIASKEFANISGTTSASMIFIGLGLLLSALAYVTTKSVWMSGVGFFSATSVGVWISSPSISYLFVSILVLIILTGLWLARRTPTS